MSVLSEVLLRELGVTTRPGASFDHNWSDEDFISKFGDISSLPKGRVAIAVGDDQKHRVVSSVKGIRTAWTEGKGIAEMLILSEALWEKHREQVSYLENTY